MAAAEKKTGFNTFAVAASAIAVLVVVWVFALFMQGGFLAARNLEVQSKVMAPVDQDVADFKGEQRALLGEGYRWIDKEQGVVGLPVERAADLVVERNGGR
ncbi:MAG TPA: hypothetical protein PLQ13_04180 [Candidatus Krumholzibacteria bacterium]|nr:hypothetical protein [Candidatus Krumholzibacteria bacterium]